MFVLDFRQGFEDLRKFVSLRFRSLLHVVEIVVAHVAARHNNHDFHLWDDGKVIIYVVSHMANLGTRKWSRKSRREEESISCY